MSKKEINTIMNLRAYGFPIWAVKVCLELNNYDYEKSLKQLKEIYFIVGDHPDVVVKRRENELKNRYKKEVEQ